MAGADGAVVEGTASVAYVCEDCGRVHNRNNPPCNDCGSMSLSVTEGAEDSALQIDEDQSWELVRDANHEVTGVGVFVYLVGLVTTGVGAALLVFGSPVVGLSLIGAGVLATPVTRQQFERRLSVRLSAVAVVALYVGVVVAGVALAFVL